MTRREGYNALMDARTDEELVDALNAGDESAFEALYLRYRDWVVRMAYRFTGNEDDALDALQETFSYVLGKFPGFELRARMTTFLYPAVRNVAIRLRDKRRRFASTEEALAAIAAPAVEADPAREDLAAVVAALPEGQREVVLLRFVDGLELGEIAGALGIPVGTVKSRLHNALRALREDRRARRYFLEDA